MRSEAEWAYIPLNEERVVARQIKERSKLDVAYQSTHSSASLQESAGSFDLQESVICTYIDLERLILACRLSDRQKRILSGQMDGYSIGDMADVLALPKERVERDFRNAVSNIVRENNEQWYQHCARKCASARK